MKFNTPLRYPGGKGRLTDYFGRVIDLNGLKDGTYIEPFAGGAGTAINLLLDSKVSRIVINDADLSVFYFWKSVIEQTDKFIDLLESVELTIKEWDRQRELQKSYDVLTRGFSTFYLNRTNRSGIIDGGMIGGRGQTGKYNIGARFNREELIRRVREIGKRSNDIDVFGIDAQHFLKTVVPYYDINSTLVYVDPPYYVKGSLLYMNFYNDQDHWELAQTIKSLEHKWILSYDNVQQIKDLYSWTNHIEFSMNYSSYEFRKGRELFFSYSGLILPEVDIIKPKKAGAKVTNEAGVPF